MADHRGLSFARQSPSVPSVPEPAGLDGRSVSGLPQGNRGTGCSIRRLVPQFYLAAAWCALCLASAVLCRTLPYSPAFSISPVLPRLLLCSLWFGGRARLTLLFMVCRARLRLCFAVPRRPANRRKQARTGADRRKQARQAQTGATGADRRRQARTGAGRRGQARTGAF